MWPCFSSVTLIQMGSPVRSVTARSVASCTTLNGVFALTTCVAVGRNHSKSGRCCQFATAKFLAS